MLSNLPALNEWKRLFPDRDPVAVHREVWGVTLVCPGGGNYVWNEKYATMESTVYGHPGQPKSGPPATARAEQLYLRRFRPDAGKRRPAGTGGVAPVVQVAAITRTRACRGKIVAALRRGRSAPPLGTDSAEEKLQCATRQSHGGRIQLSSGRKRNSLADGCADFKHSTDRTAAQSGRAIRPARLNPRITRATALMARPRRGRL